MTRFRDEKRVEEEEEEASCVNIIIQACVACAPLSTDCSAVILFVYTILHVGLYIGHITAQINLCFYDGCVALPINPFLHQQQSRGWSMTTDRSLYYKRRITLTTIDIKFQIEEIRVIIDKLKLRLLPYFVDFVYLFIAICAFTSASVGYAAF